MTTTLTKEEKFEKLVTESGLTENDVRIALTIRKYWGSVMGLTVATEAVYGSQKQPEKVDCLFPSSEDDPSPHWFWSRNAREILGIEGDEAKGAMRNIELMTPLEYCQVIAKYLKDK